MDFRAPNYIYSQVSFNKKEILDKKIEIIQSIEVEK